MAVTKTERMLHHLQTHGSATTQALAELVGVDRSSVASHLAPSAKVGTVFRQRETRPGSGRPVQVWYWGTPEVSQEPASQEEVTPTPTPTPTPHTSTLAMEVRRLADAMVELVCQDLRNQLASRIQDEVRLLQAEFSTAQIETDKVITSVQQAVRSLSVPLKLKTDSPPPRPNMPKILVLGLLPQQQQVLLREFDNLLDLRFFKDGSLKQLSSSCAGVAAVFVASSKVSHAQIESAKTSGVPLRCVQGGVTRVKEALTEYYVEHAD